MKRTNSLRQRHRLLKKFKNPPITVWVFNASSVYGTFRPDFTVAWQKTSLTVEEAFIQLAGRKTFMLTWRPDNTSMHSHTIVSYDDRQEYYKEFGKVAKNEFFSTLREMSLA